MKTLKLLLLLVGLILCSSIKGLSLPFFDNFEDENDTDLIYWDTENLEGWQYWHVIPWGGKGGGRCMRFEVCDLDQNDWLITKALDCSEAAKLVINFDFLYSGSGNLPTLYYTAAYNGNAAQSAWTELNYTPGPEQNQWHPVDEIFIDSPGDRIYLAFHYQAAANQGVYCLLDNFSVIEDSTEPLYSFNDSSQYVVFASNDINAGVYWDEISDRVDKWYLELCSYWDRPGTPHIFDPDKKLRLILKDEVSFPEQAEREMPAWKCGYFTDRGNLVTKLPLEDNLVYENSYSSVVRNTLAQYILYKHFNKNPDQSFLEAFGIYYSGYRPERAEVLTVLDNLARLPVLSDIESTENYNSLSQKILAITYIEAIVLQDSYQAIYPRDEALWQRHLKYYYLQDKESRMSLHKPSMNFDFYCIPRDTIFLDTMAVKLESLYEHYTSLFELDIHNRFNVIIYPDKATADELNGGSYSMGAAHGGDHFNILSPYLSDNSMQAASGGLVAHEFWHVIHFHMRPYNGYPNGQFIMEGMADYMPVGTQDMRTEPDLWKINMLFYQYSSQFGREPSLQDIMDNPQSIEPYLFGQLFFNLLIPSYASYIDVKNFFLGRCDWSAFKFSFNEIDKAYISYIKTLANFIPKDTLVNLPLEEDFNNFNLGWIAPCLYNEDNWRINYSDIDNSKCMRFYTQSVKNIPLDSWLISPAFNTAGMEQVCFSFDYQTRGDSLSLEVLYTDKFLGDIENANWNLMMILPDLQDNVWGNTGEIALSNVPDSLYVAIRYKASGDQHQYASIDNYKLNSGDTPAWLSLPFIDNFEDEDGTDLIYWDTENLEGWQYWHVIPWGGKGGGRCMRFEVCDLDQNDWLITKALDCSEAEKLVINFDFLYSGSGNLPTLYYTAAYNGNAAQSAWTELNYTPGPEQNQWHPVDEILIDSPGDRIYLAFHYQAAANQGVYCLLDNVSVKEYRTPSVLVGSSDHFEFYTNLQEQEDYYLDLVEELEYKYQMYQSLWERPSSNTVFPELEKIKLIYEAPSPVPNAGDSCFAWDAGSFDFQQGTIILHPLDTDKKINYYGSLEKLAVNELAQMALYGWKDASSERWFSEGFGLYEMGYRPDRQALLQKLSEPGSSEPSLSLLQNPGDLSLPGNKDLMASFFQSKVLIQCYFFGFSSNDIYKWRQLLKHYYSKETDRIELLYSSANFDFYAAEKERPYIEALAMNMEDQLALQSARFGPLMKHRFSICLYDEEVGKEINDRTDFQGLACGADKINSLPLNSDDYGLINHEFMHCWVNRISPVVQLSATSFMPGQFLNEGLAESTDGFMSEEEMTWHRYKIDDLFYHYQHKYHREPEWLEIVDNVEVNKEDGFWVDAYALGEMYWRYMYDKYPDDFWSKVGLFLRNGRDWSVFGGKSTEQEGAEFIQFMKELAFVGPPKKISSIPFFENFGNDLTGWTRMRFGGNNHWQLQENFGYDDSRCAFAVNPYWFDEDEDKNTDSWLVSPPLDASGLDSLKLEFMYRQTGLADKPEIYYTGEFSGPTDSTRWIALEGLDWNAPEAEWDKMEAQIDSPPDTLYIALRFKSGEGEEYSYGIDNFKVEGQVNSLPGNSISQHRFEVYPNPVNTASVASFVTTGAGQAQLSLYDLQGRIVMTIFDREFPEGKHIIPVGKQLLSMKTNTLSKGLYFCRLSTERGTSTIKIVFR